MLEETNNKEETVALLSDGESIIPSEKVDELKEKVEELKTEQVIEKENVIEIPKPAPKQTLGAVGNGAMGVTVVKDEVKEKKQPKTTKKEETVAIHSTRNVTWNGVGKVYIGYNIVSKSAADKWLTRDHTRLATPEEVAKEFGK